jgi:hypothetical protein
MKGISGTLAFLAVVSVVVVVTWFFLQRKRTSGQDSREGFSLGEPIRLTPEQFLAELEEEEREERATYEAYPYRFSITIYAPILPLERGARFEDPLGRALGDSGVVLGGGSSMEVVDGKQVITDVGFSARTKELEEGLATIRKCLKEQGAPTNTTIRLTEPREVDYSLGG